MAQTSLTAQFRHAVKIAGRHPPQTLDPVAVTGDLQAGLAGKEAFRNCYGARIDAGLAGDLGQPDGKIIRRVSSVRSSRRAVLSADAVTA